MVVKVSAPQSDHLNVRGIADLSSDGNSILARREPLVYAKELGIIMQYFDGAAVDEDRNNVL